MDRKIYSELPQGEGIPLVKLGVKSDPTSPNNYLEKLDLLIRAIGEHIRTIQQEELTLTNQFSASFSCLTNEAMKRDGGPEGEQTKAVMLRTREQREDVLRTMYLERLSSVRSRRAEYREMLFDIKQEKKRMLAAMELERAEASDLRKRLARLRGLGTGGVARENRKQAGIDSFSTIFFGMELLLIILYSVLVQFEDSTGPLDYGLPTGIASFYGLYTDIALMLLLGFGFLSSFLRKYQYSSIGFSLFLVAFAFQWSIIIDAFFQMIATGVFGKVLVTGQTLIIGMYGAATVLISFGAVVGVASPTQLLLMTVFEVFAYGLNIYIGQHLLGANDLHYGGATFIHFFGAFFGISMSYLLGKSFNQKGATPEDRQPSYQSDMFALLGTLVLWVFFPSFNVALSAPNTGYRVVVNTVLSLATSVIFGFLGSRVFRGGKFKMIDIQNATLAGGVAMGSVAAALIAPGGAMLTGAAASIASTLGFVYSTPYLEKKYAVADVRGVMNLHGIPGLMGAVAGMVASSLALDTNDAVYGQSIGDLLPAGAVQPAMHLAALGISFGLAVGTGLLAGYLLSYFSKPNAVLFRDERSWVVPSDFDMTDFFGGNATS